MSTDQLKGKSAVWFFSDYLKLTGVAHTDPEKSGHTDLIGKRLGLINGASWITMWSYYFGRLFLPGVHLINVGNEAVQINFMEAHQRNEPVPPSSNIAAFVGYAKELVELGNVDAIMITCSTMNRSFPQVQEAIAPYGVPVLQIDRPMMERAVELGGKTLVVATHGPTVESTQALLTETANDLGQRIEFSGLDVSKAWYELAEGNVEGHNRALAKGIRAALKKETFTSVVLAQLSMTLFLLSYPDPVAEFGVPVLTSGQCGFDAVYDIMINM